MGQKQKKLPDVQEQQKVQQPEVEASQLSPPPTGDAREAAEKALGQVQVIHGIYDSTFQIAGKAVSYAREQLKEMYNLPGDAQALINGEPVAEDTILPADSTLEFIKNAGQKGFTQ